MKKNKSTIAISLFAVAILLLSGCQTKVNESGTDVGAKDGGLKVNAPGTNIGIKGGNVNVNANGVKINVNDGKTKVKTNTNINKDNKNNANNQNKETNIIMIMDSSGSMNASMANKSKMNVAKNSAFKFIDKLNNEINLGVIAYGHKGSNKSSDKNISCEGIEEISKIGTFNKEHAKAAINKLAPTGWTPISNSLEKAKVLLAQYPSNQNKKILLISDGEETCGGNPLAKSKELKNLGISIDVVGFGVKGETEKQLKNIAQNGGGNYFSVDSPERFDIIVNDYGIKINTGDMNINISADNINVDTEDTKVEIDKNKINVETGEANIKMDGDDIDVNVPGVNVNMDF